VGWPGTLSMSAGSPVGQRACCPVVVSVALVGGRHGFSLRLSHWFSLTLISISPNTLVPINQQAAEIRGELGRKATNTTIKGGETYVKTRNVSRCVLAMTLGMMSASQSHSQPKSDPARAPDLVVLNAAVVTQDAQLPSAQALAVSGDRFVYVGADAGARARVGKGTKVIDLHERGSIEVGKKADFIVVDRNILTEPVDRIHDTKVLMTFFEGREVTH
jgi:hypothetical protein